MQTSKHEFSCLEFVDSNQRQGFCNIEALSLADGRTAIIATEVADNTGMSITNAAEQAATAACRQFGIDPNRLVWIEHYNADSYHGRGRQDSFDLVTFGKMVPTASIIFGTPAWKPMKAEDWAKLGLPPRC